MTTELENAQQPYLAKVSSTQNDSFDFDLWARQVRRQLLNALQKKQRNNLR